MGEPRANLERLPASHREALALTGRLAADAGYEAYLVGGAVRDLILERPVSELDIVIVGDALAVAELIGAAGDGKLIRHQQFGTATVQSGDINLDLVTARRERYPRPGALPEVAPGTIEHDLQRRDFTINALALAITPASWGTLLDLTNGLADLHANLIRVLHERSFQDDATRILRAVRYERRLDFTIELQTERWLSRDLAYFDTISGDRIRNELDRWWLEERPEQAFDRAEALGVWHALSLGLHYPTDLNAAFAASRSLGGSPMALRARGLALWTWILSEAVARSLIDRLRLPAEDQRACHDAWLLREQLDELPTLSNSLLARLLNGLHTEAINAAWILAPFAVCARIDQYRHSLRELKPALRGTDLERLGIPHGPAIGRALQRLQDARWDGLVTNRDDEERLVVNWLSQPGGPP